MGIEIDTSEVRAVASRIGSAGGRVGARGALALKKTALNIEADAQALAPIDTGNLRDSISASFVGDGRYGAIAAEVSAAAEYGVYQEYGTSTQPGTPFMGPAYDRQIGPFTEGIALLAAEETL